MRPRLSERPWDRTRASRITASLVVSVLTVLLVGCMSRPAPDHRDSPSPPSYYVDCSAAGGGSGSSSTPWTSTAAVAAHGAFAPGERILIRRGTTCHGRLTPTGSGTNGNPILLGAYGTGPRPVIDGGGTPDQTGTVQLTDVHDWVVQDLEVTNLDAAGPDDTLRAGILVVADGTASLSDIVVRRTVVRRVTSSPAQGSTDPHQFGGISVLVRGTAARSSALSNVRIEGNVVDHVGRMGIVAWSAAWPASPLTAVSITGNDVRWAEGDSIVVWGVDGGVIEHNTSEQGGRLTSCPRCANPVTNTASAGIWPVTSTRVLVRYNEVSGESAAGGDGQGFDIDDATSDVLLEGNFSHDNEGGGVLICGARDSDIRFNVFENNGGGEITFSCPRQRGGVRIVGNTLSLGAASSGQVVRHTTTSGTDSVVFANNVVIDMSGGGYAWPVPVSAQGNVYAGTVPASAPSDAGAATDPGFVAPGTGGTGLDSARGYTPSPGSAAASGGVLLPDIGSTDYFGRTRTDATGRGAIGALTTAPLLTAVTPVVERSGDDVALTWTADRGTGWQVQRSVASGPFRSITGTLPAGAFLDVAPPTGSLRYRLIQVGRDVLGAPSKSVGTDGA